MADVEAAVVVGAETAVGCLISSDIVSESLIVLLFLYIRGFVYDLLLRLDQLSRLGRVGLKAQRSKHRAAEG